MSADQIPGNNFLERVSGDVQVSAWSSVLAASMCTQPLPQSETASETLLALRSAAPVDVAVADSSSATTTTSGSGEIAPQAIADVWRTESTVAANATSTEMSQSDRANLYAELRADADTSEFTLKDRFKRWLKVNPGEYHRLVAAEVRAEFPGKSAKQVNSLAMSRIHAEERGKGSVHERRVSDDQVARLLTRAYIVSRDESAHKLLREIELVRVTDECRGRQRAVKQRMKEFDAAIELCQREHAKNTADHDAIAAILVERTRRLQGPDTEMVAATVPPKQATALSMMNSSNVYLAEHAKGDESGDSMRRSHLASMARSLLNSVSAHVQLVNAAPDDAVFFGRKTYSHPVYAMTALMEETRVQDLDSGPVISTDAILRYMHASLQLRNESQTDIDRALASMFDVAAFDSVRNALVRIGVSPGDAEVALVCGVSPKHSQVVSQMFDFVVAEQFEAAREAARQAKGGRRTRQKVTDAADDGSAMSSRAKQAALSIETISRNHILDYLREPARNSPWERPCLRRSSCVCQLLGSGGSVKDGFTAREFLTPRQWRKFEEEDELPADSQLCFLCALDFVTRASMAYMQQSGALGAKVHTDFELLQPYAVRVGMDGEYNASACLPTVVNCTVPTGIVLPFPAFVRANYRLTRQNVNGENLRAVIESDALVFGLGSVRIQPT